MSYGSGGYGSIAYGGGTPNVALSTIVTTLVGIIPITPNVATRIYRVLVAYADAVPEHLKAFVRQMGTTGIGIGQTEWRLKAGYYGPTCFFLDENEWYVTHSRDDISPRTLEQVDLVNLKLALLRDEILIELGGP